MLDFVQSKHNYTFFLLSCTLVNKGMFGSYESGSNSLFLLLFTPMAD